MIFQTFFMYILFAKQIILTFLIQILIQNLRIGYTGYKDTSTLFNNVLFCSGQQNNLLAPHYLSLFIITVVIITIVDFRG